MQRAGLTLRAACAGGVRGRECTVVRFPRLAFGTPRKLPRANELEGRVVVLDIAFAA